MVMMQARCRCGVELLVRHGGVTHCTHCDTHCLAPGICGFCALLSVTCTDCRTVHTDSRSRARCESQHWYAA